MSPERQSHDSGLRSQASSARILIVEDDRRTAELIALYLRHAGHKAFVEHDGAAALSRVRAERFDLLVLDRMLPGTDGIAICRTVRERGGTPVMMVTARTLEEERLEGFAAGADDYLTKPFSPRELVARVQALLRRVPPGSEEFLVAGEMTVDLAARTVTVAGEHVEVTPSEFAILAALLERPGRVWSRAALLERLPGEHDALERTIDVHVRNLRRKLADVLAAHRVRIETALGAGYRLAS